MSELSDNAKQLAATLCGRFYEINNGVISGTGRPSYDAAALVNLAQAALELAGVRVEYVDVPERDGVPANRQYVEIHNAEVGIMGNVIDVSVSWLTEPTEDLVRLAAILLHAQATAREWASESEGK